MEIWSSWIRKSNIVKMSTTPKLFCTLNAIPIKNLQKVIMYQLTSRFLNIFENSKKLEAKTVLKNYYKSLEIMTMCYLPNDRRRNQWKRVENLEIEPYMYA